MVACLVGPVEFMAQVSAHVLGAVYLSNCFTNLVSDVDTVV